MGQMALEFVAVPANHPERDAIEHFIREVFLHTYQARLQSFAQVLLGVKDERGQWVAALGFTAAKDGALFVESYGWGAAERQISKRVGRNIARDQVVEVGNLAAIHAGAARQLISSTVEYLYHQGFSWVIFTATRLLLNAFHRLDLRPLVLAPADPMRLPDQGASWGRYYQTDPQIVAGSILSGYVSLSAKSGKGFHEAA